jgi:hypothetical protein
MKKCYEKPALAKRGVLSPAQNGFGSPVLN